jgi:Recombination endonuclease VII
MPKYKQIPGEFYTFRSCKTGEKVTVKLPLAGVSNSEVQWRDRSTYQRSGTWVLRKFSNESMARSQRGEGPSGLISRMRAIIGTAKNDAKKLNYQPIQESPQKLVEQWNKQNGLCAACGEAFGNEKSCYDHDHETGKGRGFIHQTCNTVEGRLKAFSNKRFLKLMYWLRPHLFGDQNVG